MTDTEREYKEQAFNEMMQIRGFMMYRYNILPEEVCRKVFDMMEELFEYQKNDPKYKGRVNPLFRDMPIIEDDNCPDDGKLRTVDLSQLQKAPA